MFAVHRRLSRSGLVYPHSRGSTVRTSDTHHLHFVLSCAALTASATVDPIQRHPSTAFLVCLVSLCQLSVEQEGTETLNTRPKCCNFLRCRPTSCSRCAGVFSSSIRECKINRIHSNAGKLLHTQSIVNFV